MIRLYFNPAPNPFKIALFLEEAGVDYQVVAVETLRREQHQPAFLAINPNGKVPAIIDTDGPSGSPVRVFDSGAILLYLAEKVGRFLGSPEDRPELLSWMGFISTGLGPFSGQAVHFQRVAPERPPYAVNRYRRELERHYGVLDRHLDGRAFIVGNDYGIADIAAWGWIDWAAFALPGADDPLTAYPNIRRWFDAVNARPAVARARLVGSGTNFRREFDDEAMRSLFPSNYPAE